MNAVFRHICLMIFVALLTTGTTVVAAGSSKDQYAFQLVSLRKIIEATKTDVNLTETSKVNLLKLYFGTEDHLEELVDLQLKVQIAQNQLKNLPSEIKQLQKKIQKTEVQPATNSDQNLSRYSSDGLVQLLTDDKISQEQLTASISRLETQLVDQQKRPQQIREQLAETKKSKVNIAQKKAKLASRKKNKKEREAYKNLIDSHASELEIYRIWLELEKSVTPLSIQAKKLELELLNLQSERLSSRIKTIEDYQNEKREQELGKAQAELIRAQQQAADKPPVIQKEILKNFRYNQLLLEVTQNKEIFNEQKKGFESHYAQLEKDFKSAEKKINLAGLSPALGNLLREQRRNLPLKKSYQDEFESIQNEIALGSLELFKLEETEKDLANLDTAVQSRITESVLTDNDDVDTLNIRNELQVLLKDQKRLVSQLSSEYPDYARTLADVDFSLHQLVALGERYRFYLDQRLLWVPSAPTIDTAFFLELGNSLVWFSKTSHWNRLVEDIEACLKTNPLLAFVGLAALAFQLHFRKRIKFAYGGLLKRSNKVYSDKFVFTFYGLGYSFLIALPLAFVVVWLGWLLSLYHQAAHFSTAVANGLLTASIPLIIISFFHQLFRPKGFVQILFNWQEHHVDLLFRLLNFIRMVAIPVVFILGLFTSEAYGQHSQTLGRMALIVGMLALCYMLHRLAHPVKGLANGFYQVFPDIWISRMRYIWYGMLVIMPLIVIVFAIAGYYQSALELQGKLIIIIRIIFFTALLHEVVMRWLVLANRQLALQNARQKRKQHEHAEEKDKEYQETAKQEPVIKLEEDELFDIPKINEQSKKILRVLITTILVVGIWFALRDILPALAIFDKVVLWRRMAMIDGKEISQAITMVNVFAVIIYLILVLVFVKNFPGLLDLVFAGRYSLTAGGRYALVQLTRYGVIALTIIAIANQLGGSWSQVQWLVAAVSVGLGFGLQEIFANMVSGIILLFERPIRVGDTVTIGEIDGRVSRIQMRATTIVNWDQKELVVPNKSFITEKLVNWTLSDTTTRIVIPVGVAYNSDIDQVKSILEKVVSENPLVLDDPAPAVFFLEFGDSSLNFSVRVFVRELGDRLTVTNDLHSRIKIAFDEQNIEIPFPQRDINVRSNEAVPVPEAGR